MDENGNVEIGNGESGQGCGNYANGKTLNGLEQKLAMQWLFTMVGR